MKTCNHTERVEFSEKKQPYKFENNSYFIGENLRREISKYHDEKAKTVQEQRDLEVAMWHQLKINNQEEQERDKGQYDSGINSNQDQGLPSYSSIDR